MIVREGEIELTWSADWNAIKWDGCDFRKRREHRGKAADVLAVHQISEDGDLLIIEIKDYPAPSQAPVPQPSELAKVCVAKARDTLAQVLYSPPLGSIGRPSDTATDELCRAFGSTERPLTFILLLEDANEPPLELIELQIEIEQAFRWLPSRVATAATIEDLDEMIGGLSVRRVSS